MIVCITGQTFIVVQQQSNANNTSLSPHYSNTSVPTNPDSGQSYMNWSQSEPTPEDYHKNTNGISDKLGVSGGRRTPYNTMDGLPNGSIYHSFANNSQFNNSNETQSNANNNNINNNNNNSNTNTNHINNNNTNAKSNTSNSNSSTSFTPTTTYSTNQSQSFASPPNQEYSPHESSNTSLPGLSARQTQRPNSRSSPARAVSNGSANSVNKSMENEGIVSISSNGVTPPQSHLSNEQTLENEPFLVNTTTTMPHNLSDLTTSMNTSTGSAYTYLFDIIFY